MLRWQILQQVHHHTISSSAECSDVSCSSAGSLMSSLLCQAVIFGCRGCNDDVTGVYQSWRLNWLLLSGSSQNMLHARVLALTACSTSTIGDLRQTTRKSRKWTSKPSRQHYFHTMSSVYLHTATPILHSDSLSAASGLSVTLKLDNLQPSGSFKIRGVGYMCCKVCIALLHTSLQHDSHVPGQARRGDKLRVLIWFVHIMESFFS